MQGHSLRVPALCKEARSPERSPFCFWPRCTLLLSLVRRTCSSCPPLPLSRKPHATPRCSAARAGDALPFAARTGACICVLRLTTIPPTRQPLPCARAREREREAGLREVVLCNRAPPPPRLRGLVVLECDAIMRGCSSSRDMHRVEESARMPKAAWEKERIYHQSTTHALCSSSSILFCAMVKNGQG